MSKLRQMTRKIFVFACLVILALVATALIATPRADATFPGRNSKIVFSTDRGGNWDIYAIEPDGSRQWRLTDDPANELAPTWSVEHPDRFAYTSDKTGDWNIYFRILCGWDNCTNQIKLVRESIRVNPGPDLAPSLLDPGLFSDSEQEWDRLPIAIAFEKVSDDNHEIFVVSRGKEQDVTNNRADDGAPSWSSWTGYRPHEGPGCGFILECDARLRAVCRLPTPAIAFHSNRGGTYDIYRMDESGREVARVTRGSAADFNPSWSPDCRYIAFERRRAGNYDVWIVGIETGVELRVTTSDAVDGDPVWSPDGRQIAFVSDRDGNDEIYVADLRFEGERLVGAVNARNVTRNEGADVAPDWPSVLEPPHAGGTAVDIAPPGSSAVRCTKSARGRRGTTLRGGSGRDVLCGGPGADTLVGNGGDDILIGKRGRDILRGNAGNDDLRAKDGLRDREVDGGRGSHDAAEVDRGPDPHRGVEAIR